jgi:inosose dehydratase
MVGTSIAAPAQKCRIGYQIFGWGRYFPEAWWTAAAAVVAVGYPGIEGEYTISELYDGRESEFRDRMERLGVRLAALYSTTDLERLPERSVNLEKNLRAARFCREMGAEVLVIGGTEAESRSDEDFRHFAAVANELGRLTYETHGVRCGYHPHLGSLVQNREEIGRIMELTDPEYLFLAPDTGHLLAGGGDPVEVCRTYGERIIHTHLKDFKPAASPGRRGAFVPLGWGEVDFPGLVRVLDEKGFSGWHTVELDSTRGLSQEEVAELARHYIEETLNLSVEIASAD